MPEEIVDNTLDKLIQFLETRPNKVASNKKIVSALQLWSTKQEFIEWRRQYLESSILVKHRGQGGATALPSEIEPKSKKSEITKYGISEGAKNLLELIPQDGSSVGNTYLQTISGKKGEEYWRIRDELLRASLIERGKGRGGSVSRTQSTLDTLVEKTADFVKEERDLYVPLKNWLEEEWGKEVENDGDYYRVRVTSSPMGRKRNSGQWSRPDVTFVRVTKYEHLPNTIVEVTSFEVKRNADAKDLASVYEAAAHSRWAHNTYLVVEIANHDLEVDVSIRKECARLGVGLLTVSRTHNKYYFAELLEPKRQEPSPEDLDKFLKDFFADDPREQKQFKIRIK